MASLLRQIVAGPRARHPEAGLDLCYVTDNIIATSGPSQTYPQRAYRNPLDRLVAFLDSKHGKNWAIWEFRAEGTGYPDHMVYERIRHYPWPDHHPPPFRLVPLIVASMRNWLNGNDLDADGVGSEKGQPARMNKVLDIWKDKKNPRVIVVHCKAGKGRSGTMACSFLISECGWTPEQALARFTERRMRPKFGPGVSIPSQLRYIGYVDRWTKNGKKYVDREVEIVEIHVWGLRNGVKASVEGYVDEGKKIKVFHTFKREERLVVEGDAPGGGGFMDTMYDMAGYRSPTPDKAAQEERQAEIIKGSTAGRNGTMTPESSNLGKLNLSKSRTSRLISTVSRNSFSRSSSKDKFPHSTSKQDLKSSSSARSSTSNLNKPDYDPEPGGQAVIFKSNQPIRIPNSDVNIGLERRNRAPSSMGLTMVTSVAHVWFNPFFEGNGPEQDGRPNDTGVFEIEWDKMDGIKGSRQKGTMAADRIAVVWQLVKPEEERRKADVILEPGADSPVPQMQAADWQRGSDENPDVEKHLGLRVSSPDSASVSQASSIKGEFLGKGKDIDPEVDSINAVKSDVPDVGAEGEVEPKENVTERKASAQNDDELEAYAAKLPSPEGSQEKLDREDHTEG